MLNESIDFCGELEIFLCQSIRIVGQQTNSHMGVGGDKLRMMVVAVCDLSNLL